MEYNFNERKNLKDNLSEDDVVAKSFGGIGLAGLLSVTTYVFARDFDRIYSDFFQAVETFRDIIEYCGRGGF